MVSEYIGKNADKLIDQKNNWIAAGLGQAIGPVWFFFRKSYLLGFAFLVVTFIVGGIASAIELSEASYIMFFIYLFTANKLYIWDVRRKVKKIVSSSSNMSENQLIAIVREKGGTSIVSAVIYVVAFIAFIIIYFWAIYSVMFALMSM